MNYSQLQRLVSLDRALRNHCIHSARSIKSGKPLHGNLDALITDARWLNREIIKHKRMIRALQQELPL